MNEVIKTLPSGLMIVENAPPERPKSAPSLRGKDRELKHARYLDDGKRVECRVRIEGSWNGKDFVHEDAENSYSQFIWVDNDDPSTYWWVEGNFSCDCNRCTFLPDEMCDDNGPEWMCGEEIKIRRIVPFDDTLPILEIRFDGKDDYGHVIHRDGRPRCTGCGVEYPGEQPMAWWDYHTDEQKQWERHWWVCRHPVGVTCPDCRKFKDYYPHCPECGCSGEYT